jgi:hypothetical protein
MATLFGNTIETLSGNDELTAGDNSCSGGGDFSLCEKEAAQGFRPHSGFRDPENRYHSIQFGFIRGILG